MSMTLKEALEIEATPLQNRLMISMERRDASRKLLLAAGERIQHARDHHTLANTDLLPGEAKE